MQTQILPQEQQNISEDILIAGGGPAGAFLGYILATEFGYTVRVIESHPDLRNPSVDYVDRSSCVTLFKRGLDYLEKHGLGKEIRKIGIPMDRKCLYLKDMDMELPIPEQGKKDMIALQVGRRQITSMLIQKLEDSGKAQFEFETKILAVDLDKKLITTQNKKTLEEQTRNFNFILGADGFRSLLRQEIEKREEKPQNNVQHSQYIMKFVDVPTWEEFQEMINDKEKYSFYHTKVPQKYKDRYAHQFFGKFKVNPGGLHVWGGTNQFMLGLPALNNRVNIIFALPENEESIKNIALLDEQVQADPSRLDLQDFSCFSQLKTDEDIEKFVLEKMPQMAGLIPNIVEQIKNKYTYKSQTVFYDKWFYEEKTALFGEAAHGMTPFSGTGLSVILKNISAFIDILRKGENAKNFVNNPENRKTIFKCYQDSCLEDTRPAQRNQLDELLYPGLSYAGNPRAGLYMMVTGMIEAQHPDIFMEKIHLVGYTRMPFKEVRARMKVYYKLVTELIANVQSPQDVDLTGIREKIISKLEEAGISPKININM